MSANVNSAVVLLMRFGISVTGILRSVAAALSTKVADTCIAAISFSSVAASMTSRV